MFKKIYLYGFLVLMFFSSCNDFLEVEDPNVNSINNQFSTFDGIKQVLNGCYLELAEQSTTIQFIYGDYQGGNIAFSPTISGSNQGLITVPTDIRNSYDFNDLSNNSDYDDFYENAYTNLNAINLILEKTDGVEASIAQKNQIKAEALAIRAFIHSQLLLLYSQDYGFANNASHKGIVYANRVFIGGIDFPSRNSVAQCYDFVVADYLQAISLFQSTSIFTLPNYAVFNKNNVKALLARVYLEKKDYSNAILLANDVLLNSGISLTSNATLVSQWEQTNLPISEVLLELLPRVADDGSLADSVSEYYSFVSPTDYDKYVASLDIINLYDANDIRRNLFIIQPINTKISANSFEIRDYYFTKKNQDNAGTMIIRLSEMYAILAEAHFKQGNLLEATNHLNVLRNRAGLPNLATTISIEEILLERRKEFCFENQYFFDLKRNQKNVVRNQGCLSLQCNLTYPNNKYVLPIPQASINVNSNMQQNEGY
jgi:starch-binding outer membrane protein, SusD/RagB family